MVQRGLLGKKTDITLVEKIYSVPYGKPKTTQSTKAYPIPKLVREHLGSQSSP